MNDVIVTMSSHRCIDMVRQTLKECEAVMFTKINTEMSVALRPMPFNSVSVVRHRTDRPVKLRGSVSVQTYKWRRTGTK